MRALNLRVKDSKQIRASVITHWLKHYNIRKVQYMAGHRYISSTERYVQDNLEDLHEMIENLHPIS
ncbi:MAG TPA: integrase [Aequorivita sp.]|nr:integrase [Pusillimonas sp.]HAV54320.1 integrase [Aequorivita sp.]